MSRTPRLGLSLEPANTAQPWKIFNELIKWIESGFTEFVKDNMTQDMTIPESYQYIVFGSFDIDATLTLEGTLVVL